MNIIAQYFAQIFCSPIEVIVQEMEDARLVLAALMTGSQRHFTHLDVGFNLACIIISTTFTVKQYLLNLLSLQDME